MDGFVHFRVFSFSYFLRFGPQDSLGDKHFYSLTRDLSYKSSSCLGEDMLMTKFV